jgi:KDO2-lipid IV(A) lauroyltransferase
VALAIGRFLGYLAYYVIPIRRGVAFQNIDRVFGTTKPKQEKRRIVRSCYANLGMYGIELLRLPLLTFEVGERLVKRQGFEHLDTAYARSKGVIIVAVHIGNIDYVACSMSVSGISISSVVKRISWKPAQEFITMVRERTGWTIFPPRSKAKIYESLKENKVVMFYIDQHLAKQRAIVCEFFGQLASTSPAPARFALETGATIVPALIYREDHSGHHVLRLSEPLKLETPYEDMQMNIRHNTELLNRIVEGWIREFPEQWLWLHKRWKVQDDPGDWDIPDNLRHLLKKRLA